ncbi:MAG TPA: 4'-phosphopantetheinyl transferase superfamily protein [Anaerolineales bacterium]|nr:4'-phosphopantetheinyl transferase superfamily protein [Anaerolineales bacterium]
MTEFVPPAADVIHLWRFDLNQANIPAKWETVLSQAELARAERFRFEHHRIEWVKGRYALRWVLARYLQTQPAAVQIVTSPFGKPLLEANLNLHFNLSHSRGHWLLAVAKSPVGVDLEWWLRADTDWKSLASAYYCAAEKLALTNSQSPAQTFFQIWSAKEAYLKAVGTGIVDGLAELDTTQGKIDKWWLHSFPSIFPQCQAFVATENPTPQFTLNSLSEYGKL